MTKRKQLSLATWNIRTGYHDRHLIANKEMDRLKIDVLGIAEHRWPGEGHFTLPNGGKCIYSGKEKGGQGGVGFLLSKRTATSLLGYNPVNDRILSIRLKGPIYNITIIQVYAPTTTAEDEEYEDFLNRLQHIYESSDKHDIKIIVGDFNAKVGEERHDHEREIRGPHGLGGRNTRGERLLSFCMELKLAVMNTFFEQHPRRLFTWSSPDGATKNQIDYILVQQRWRSGISATKTFPGADCGSDHQLLAAKFKTRLKKINKTPSAARFNTSSIPTEYNIEIQNKFDELAKSLDEIPVDELSNSIKDILVNSAHKLIPKRIKKKQPYISEETLKLITQRRKLKSRRHTDSSNTYKTLSKHIRAQIRREKTKYVQDACSRIENMHEKGFHQDMFAEVKQLRNNDTTTSLRVINDKQGRPLTEIKDIVNRWKEYCQEMFNAVPTNTITEETFEEEPEPLIDEVRNAIKYLKKGKAPGCDGIAAEMIQAGGESGVRIFHTLCCKIWKEKTWPMDWKRSVFIPFPKKGNLKDCTNYRTIALISHASKILLRIIMKRLEKHLYQEINITQAGFRTGRGTRDHILNMRNIIEKCREFNVNLHTCFIDYSKAFDCVQHQPLWSIMNNMGFPKHLVRLISSLYDGQQATVKIEGDTSEWFEIEVGVRQGCILSPHLFNIYAENIMRSVKEDPSIANSDIFSIGGYHIPELRYADDTVLLANSVENLEQLIKSTKIHSEAQNLFLNVKKTKIMTTDKTEQKASIQLNNEEIESVNHFEYLGSLITNNGDCSKEIIRRLAIASQKFNQLKNLWNGSLTKTKLRIIRAVIFPVATYGCESWTLNKYTEKRICAFELKCYRKMLKISWTEKRSNASILQSLNVQENWLVSHIKQRKLRFFGHIKRHNSLERVILEGAIQGKRGRGRPRRRWTQDIIETTKKPLEVISHLANDREEFRKLTLMTTFYKGHVT